MFEIEKIASCIDGYDPNALPIIAANAFIERAVCGPDLVEIVALRDGLNRVLATDQISTFDVPAHDNSAMDGFAFRGCEIAHDGDSTFEIVGSSLAGHRFTGQVPLGSAVRITTGAVMPNECDTVVPKEYCEVSEQHLRFPAGTVATGNNRRRKGEDLANGKFALNAGKYLRPADIGLLASLAMVEVPVWRRLRVAFFSTGDELRSLGQPLEEGCVYDSNRYTLWSMLTRLGCDVVDMGVVPDNLETLKDALKIACHNADLIVTSGGVSVGEADYVKQAMADLGECAFWRVAMRPGRPLAFGEIRNGDDRAWIFGLPGNPVAVMITFYAMVQPAIEKMMGMSNHRIMTTSAKSLDPLRKRAGRTEFQRGTVFIDGDGQLVVRLTGSQGSGVLRSMADANALIVLEHDRGQIEAGELVSVWLFDGLV